MSLRPRHIGQYFHELWKGWQSKMSGVFSLVALLIGLFQSSVAWQRFWVIASFLSLATASFAVWFRTRPDIRFEIRRVAVDSGLTVPEVDAHATYLTFQIFFVNTDSKENEIDSYKLIVERNTSPMIGVPVPVTNMIWEGQSDGLWNLNEFRERPLIQGRSSTGDIRFRLADQHVFNRKWCLTIKDVYGVSYKIRGMIPMKWVKDVRYFPDR